MLDKLQNIEPDIPFLDVSLCDCPVGKLAKTKEGTIAFQYCESWLNDGFSISPFSLPLESKVFIAEFHPFSGIHGIFDDSLPDGWGRLLVDRLLRKHEIDPLTVDPMLRLAIVGQSGMGALEYKPAIQLTQSAKTSHFDTIAQECLEILRTDSTNNFDELFALGGSSGGARPKILTKIDGEDWIVKFPSTSDPQNIGLKEYELALKAHECGIEMPEVRLLPSEICAGYFATKRFDREYNTMMAYSSNRIPRKIHMASAGALLETSHRIPNLDYDILLKLTLKLTDDISEVRKLFNLMAFNVYAKNRDDHAKNFSFLCDDRGKWRLSPGYDLTENAGINGEHTTTVNGKGKDITRSDMEEVGMRAGLRPREVREIIDCMQTAFANN